jgi:hypothetical protein
MSIWNEVDLGEVARGWYLLSGDWNGEPVIGLSRGNHPDFIFPLSAIPGGSFVRDPTIDMDDATLNTLPEKSAAYAQMVLNGKQIDYVEGAMTVMPEVGYLLVNACIANGYNPLEGRFTCWLLEKMAELVERAPALAAADLAT